VRTWNFFVIVFALFLGEADTKAQESRLPETDMSVVPIASVGTDKSKVARTWAFVEDLGRGDNSSDLFGVNAQTGKTQKIGETGLNFLADITFTPRGDLFATTFSEESGDSYVVQLNQYTAKWNKWWKLPWNMRPSTLESDKKSRLWVAGRDGFLYRINRTITHIKRIGPINREGTLSPAGDIVFRQNGRLYGSMLWDDTTNVLARISKDGNAAIIVGEIGYTGVFGLAFGPNNKLYGLAHGNDPNPPVIQIKTKLRTDGLPLGTLASRTNLPSAGGMTARRILPPVNGKFTFTKGTWNDSHTDRICLNDPGDKWTFCQHQTGFHQPGLGDAGADETYAWDLNIADKSDYGKPVFAVAPGKVVRYGGSDGKPPGMSKSAGVLIEHKADSGTWWSGYLHMENLTAEAMEVGAPVGTETQLGTIGATGLMNLPICIGRPKLECAHLHFVVYLGENTPGGLISVDATFFRR